jgi:NAD-dependent dihydropyrimidine dehydrogenase PreA subunit
MIEIAIDDKACVSCSLCAEICPTDVLTFSAESGLPEVTRPGECFGCLSCSEICPSACIEHRELILSQCFHHDPYALRLGTRLGSDIEHRFNVPEDDKSRDQALADLSIRLLSIAEVFKRTLGSSLPAVGTMAGRTLARHLPRHRSPGSLEEVLALATRQFAPAWNLQTVVDGERLMIAVRDCLVREVCQERGIDLGGELCTLFYSYLSGYIAAMARVRLRKAKAEPGDERCGYEIRIYPQL